MLFLLFRLGLDRYALAAEQIVAVTPWLVLKAIPQAPLAVAGLCLYCGAPVPVLDLSALALGRPAVPLLSTRIVFVPYPHPDGEPRLLGLLAEGATQTLRLAESDFAPAGVRSAQAPWLGPVAVDGGGLIQRIDIADLLPPALRALLFSETEAA